MRGHSADLCVFEEHPARDCVESDEMTLMLSFSVLREMRGLLEIQLVPTVASCHVQGILTGATGRSTPAYGSSTCTKLRKSLAIYR